MAAFFIATVYICIGMAVLTVADIAFGFLYELNPRFRKAFDRFYRRTRGL